MHRITSYYRSKMFSSFNSKYIALLTAVLTVCIGFILAGATVATMGWLAIFLEDGIVKAVLLFGLVASVPALLFTFVTQIDQTFNEWAEHFDN